MANGFKVFSVGEVLTAADVNDYLMEQSIGIFADSTARDAQITSPIEGQFCYLADSDVLQLYTTSWNDYIGAGDISAVNTSATSGLSGGASSGAVSLVIAPNSATAATVAGSDIVLIGDADDSNNLKKTTAQDIANLAPAGGLSMLDVFKLTSSISATNGDITANLSRVSYTGFSQLGSGMTESSGIFTFPATGFYEVSIQPNMEINNDPSGQVLCVFSNDNFSSETNVLGASMGTRAAAGATFFEFDRSVILDITNVSTHKVKFKTDSFASGTVLNADNTRFMFKKLADT